MTICTTASETLAETIHAQRKTPLPAPANGKRRGNRLMAALVSVSMLAVSATPSHADKAGDNLAKALAAALVLGLIVNSIDNSQPHRTHRPRPVPQPVYQPRLPSRCAVEMYSEQYGRVRMYPERCLRREGFHYRLPDCGRAVRIYGQPDWVYSEQCMHRGGFRVDY